MTEAPRSQTESPSASQVETYSGGFKDPVFDAQATFRAVLDAFARPGQIVPLAARTHPPKALPPLAADVLCAMADQETSVFLCPPLGTTKAVAGWLRFQTGAPNTTDPATADFVVAAQVTAMPALSLLAMGTSEYPDRSTTVLIHVTSLSKGDDPVTLTGPGIKDSQRFAPAGLPIGFWDQIAANHALYPRGVDLLFLTRDGIAALPRSTAIAKGEA